jgi:hypothetical protein
MEFEFMGGPQDGLRLAIERPTMHYLFAVLCEPPELWGKCLDDPSLYALATVRKAVYQRRARNQYVYVGEED